MMTEHTYTTSYIRGTTRTLHLPAYTCQVIVRI